MSLNLNPMGITSGVWPGNYQQPNTAPPASNASVATYAVGANVLNISQPVPAYVQPGQTDTQPAWVNSGGALPTVV